LRQAAIHKPFNDKAVLLFVADEVSADNCAGYVLDRLITDDIGRVEDRHLALIRFACLYRLERRPGENGSNRSAASVRVRHVRGDANAFVTPFNEQRRRHPFPSFLCNLIDHGQVVVYFGRAEIQAGASLPPTVSLPSIFGAPNFAVSSFKAAPWALPALVVSIGVAKTPIARTSIPRTKTLLARGVAAAGVVGFIFGSSLVSGGFMPVL
jgi:hypothetical protein